jgi:hypothetical protein
MLRDCQTRHDEAKVVLRNFCERAPKKLKIFTMLYAVTHYSISESDKESINKVINKQHEDHPLYSRRSHERGVCACGNVKSRVALASALLHHFPCSGCVLSWVCI